MQVQRCAVIAQRSITHFGQALICTLGWQMCTLVGFATQLTRINLLMYNVQACEASSLLTIYAGRQWYCHTVTKAKATVGSPRV